MKHFLQVAIILMVSLMTLNLVSLNTYAGELNTNPISEVTTGKNSGGYLADDVGINHPNVPSVSVDKAADFVGGKMYDIIAFLQVIAKPLCIMVGAISVMLALLGVFGDSGMLYKGITGIIIAALCYFGIMYAPELIAFINGWMAEGSEAVLSQTL